MTKNSTSGGAIGLLMIGVMAGLGLDLCAKQLLQTYSLEQFIFLRSMIGIGLFFSIARHFGGLRALRTRNWHWHAFRTLLSTGAMFGFFYGLTQMPLIEALTLGFTAPLMVTALSAVVLDETVGWRRWLAVIVGFAGVLIMLRPGSGAFTYASAAVLLAAFCYACLAISSRKLGAQESGLSLSLYVIIGPTLVSACLVWNSGWSTPDNAGWFLFALAGACSVVAWLGIVGGYRRASPAMLAPFEYSALVLGAVAGYLIWNEVPDRYTLIGASIIVGSGLFVAYREIGRPLANRYIRALTASALKPRRK